MNHGRGVHHLFGISEDGHSTLVLHFKITHKIRAELRPGHCDGIVRGHEDGACLRQGGDADGAAHVVGEDGEGGAVRNDACAMGGGIGIEMPYSKMWQHVKEFPAVFMCKPHSAALTICL